MSVVQISDVDATRLPVWLDWVLSNTQSGLVVLDADMRIVFANKWFLLRSRLAVGQVTSQALLDVFPVLRGGHFERALVKAMRSGFPALMSQTLHPSPFPLYAPVLIIATAAIMAVLDGLPYAPFLGLLLAGLLTSLTLAPFAAASIL